MKDISIDVSNYQPSQVLTLLRKSTGLSLSGFAKLIGKSKTWVYNNEKGITKFYFNDLLNILKILNLQLEVSSIESEG